VVVKLLSRGVFCKMLVKASF